MMEKTLGYMALLLIVTATASIGWYLRRVEGPILQARRLAALVGRGGFEAERRLAALSQSVALAREDYSAKVYPPVCRGCKILISHSKRNLCWVCEANSEQESDMEWARR